MPGIDTVMEEHADVERQSTKPQSDMRRPGHNFVSRLTSPGRGAIAVLRVWGPNAVEITDAVFRPHRGTRLATTPRGRLRLGRIGHGLGDEVVAVVLGPDPPALEVQCHGGIAAVNLVVGALEGARHLATGIPLTGQHTHDAFAGNALDDLAFAPTVLTAEILLDQAQGALRNELIRLRHAIADAPDRSLEEIETLMARARIGLRLRTGWSVAIAGRPTWGRAGCSMLLLGLRRAIVDSTPGTTRDVVSQKVVFGGWPVELADTAGLRESDDLVESIGVERSHREEATG